MTAEKEIRTAFAEMERVLGSLADAERRRRRRAGQARRERVEAAGGTYRNSLRDKHGRDVAERR